MAGLSVCLAFIYWNPQDPSLSVMMLLPFIIFAIASVVLDLAAMGYRIRRDRVPQMIMMSVLQCVQLRLTWASFSARFHGLLPSCRVRILTLTRARSLVCCMFFVACEPVLARTPHLVSDRALAGRAPSRWLLLMKRVEMPVVSMPLAVVNAACMLLGPSVLHLRAAGNNAAAGLTTGKLFSVIEGSTEHLHVAVVLVCWVSLALSATEQESHR